MNGRNERLRDAESTGILQCRLRKMTNIPGTQNFQLDKRSINYYKITDKSGDIMKSF